MAPMSQEQKAPSTPQRKPANQKQQEPQISPSPSKKVSRSRKKQQEKVTVMISSDEDEQIDVGDTLQVVEAIGQRTRRGRQITLPER